MMITKEQHEKNLRNANKYKDLWLREERIKRIRRLYDERGLTFGEIAIQEQISYQRVFVIYHGRGVRVKDKNNGKA